MELDNAQFVLLSEKNNLKQFDYNQEKIRWGKNIKKIYISNYNKNNRNDLGQYIFDKF